MSTVCLFNPVSASFLGPVGSEKNGSAPITHIISSSAFQNCFFTEQTLDPIAHILNQSAFQGYPSANYSPFQATMSSLDYNFELVVQRVTNEVLPPVVYLR